MPRTLDERRLEQAAALRKSRRLLAAFLLVLVACGAALGDGLDARSPSAAALRSAAEDPAIDADRAAPALGLAAFEASLARAPKLVPPAIRDGLSRREPQDVVVLFFSADEEVRIGRWSVSPEQARRRRAERYAAVKRTALFSAGLEDDVVREYRQLPMVHLRLKTTEALEQLLSRPEVAAVYEDAMFRTKLAESLPLIGQPAAAAAGHRGAGTTVVVIDSGVDYTRAAFGSCTAPGQPADCKVIVSEDLAAPDNALDASSIRHGTLVSGIVVGAAPEARLAVLDVFDGAGAFLSTILEGLNWTIANKDRYNIVAVNLSLGNGVGETAPCVSSPYTPVLTLLRSEAILSVVASGNQGFTDRLDQPTCVPGAVSVGAVYDADFGPFRHATCTDAMTSADRVACFSDSASFLTLLAPGGSIIAAELTGTGTSLAAPHVAGAIAALKGSYPTENADQIVSRLVSTGVPLTDPKNGLTKPRLNLAAAAAAVTPPPPPPADACPAQVVPCPVTISGSLSSSSCGTGRLSFGQFTDVYEFSGVAGQTVTITMSSTADSAIFDPFLILLAPSGTIASQNDDFEPFVSRNSRLVFTLTQTGTWRIEATTFVGGMTGPYVLSITGCAGGIPSSCAAGPNTLCLSGGRFRVQTGWRTADGRSGSGGAVPLTSDTGYFWFFDPANVETIVKVLNACGVNQRIWTFAGGLTDVEVTTTVEDTVAGTSRAYRNPRGTAFLPIQDTQAFSTCSANPSVFLPAVPPGVPPVRHPKLPDAATSRSLDAVVCTTDSSALCLSGSRFRVTAAWRASDGRTGAGTAVPLTSDTGYFWFFDPGNVEMVVKVLNACGVNQHIWAFAGGLTNVEVTMTVEDTNTGSVRTYRNPQGTAFAPIQDTGAFATCP